MNKSDKRKFVEVLTSLSDLYDASISENSIQLYWDILQKYSIDEFVLSAKAHASTSKWMPKPSDFIDSLESATPSSEEKAIVAWAAVTSSTRSIGGNTSVRFDDPLIHAVIRSLGGWSGLCASSATYFQTTMRRQFIATYQSMYNLCVLGLKVDGLLPLQGRDRGREVEVKTQIPSGPQHLLLKEQEKELLTEGGTDDSRVKRLVSGVSEATKIHSNSRGLHNEVLQGKKGKRKKGKGADGDD